MDVTASRFSETRARMDDEERAEFDAYVESLPEGVSVFWRCTFTNAFDGVQLTPSSTSGRG